MSIQERIAASIIQKAAILFVGAGISAGLGLPIFRQLMDEMAEQLGYDADIFRTYGNEQLRAQYYVLKKGGLAGFCNYLDSKWKNAKLPIEQSVVHNLIVDLDFPLIYTTNWDDYLERAFTSRGKSINKIVQIADFAKVVPDRTQIVKFHGDLSVPSSLVLSEETYLKRLRLNTPLDVRLASDLLGKVVVFIGYSLADMDIRNLLFWLKNQWEKEELGAARPEIVFVTHQHNPVQKEVLKHWGVETVVSNEPDANSAVIDFLTQLKARVRAPLDE